MTPHQDPAIPALPAHIKAHIATLGPVTNLDLWITEYATACYAAGRAAGVQGEAWVSVEDRLPDVSGIEDGETVLVANRGGSFAAEWHGTGITGFSSLSGDQFVEVTHWREIPVLYTAPQAETLAVAEGFVLVPREPTRAMCLAAQDERENYPIRSDANSPVVLWRAMLAAAPTPTASIAPTEPLCACKDRPASQCTEEWGPDCDLGNNAKHVQRAPAGSEAAVDATLGIIRATPKAHALVEEAKTAWGRMDGVRLWIALDAINDLITPRHEADLDRASGGGV